eukprot:jgi/Phyca11/100761/e_gw1.5.1310.1
MRSFRHPSRCSLRSVLSTALDPIDGTPRAPRNAATSCDASCGVYPSSMKSRMNATSCLESDFLCLFVLSHPRGTAVYHANQVSTSGVVFDRRRRFTGKLSSLSRGRFA